MKKVNRLIAVYAFGLAASIVISCVSSNPRESLRNQISQIPAKNFGSYTFDSSSELIDRIQEAPSFVIDYLSELDQVTTYTPYIPSDDELHIIKKNLAILPHSHEEILRKRLVGIYFINNLLGSGFADYVLDSNDDIYCFLAVNPETLRHDLSEWMTIRERTCFIQDGSDFKISLNLGKEYTGFIYILLHETTHVVDYIRHITPYVEGNMKLLGYTVEETAFTSPIWDSYAVPKSEYDFEYRSEVTFYGFGGGPKIAMSDAVSVYQSLSLTRFASLYGGLNWAEDFAEYFTWYYLTNDLGQPYTINVYEDDRLVFSLKPMESPDVLSRWTNIDLQYMRP